MSRLFVSTLFRNARKVAFKTTASRMITVGATSTLAAASFVFAAEKPQAPVVAQQPGNVDYAAVRKAIEDMLESNPNYDDGSYGPLAVRGAWHASGTYSKYDKTGGSNGGRIRFAPESKWGANAGLDLFVKLLEPIKARFPGITYADLYTLAGAVAIEHMGGPKINWKPGRVDYVDGNSSPADGRLPDALKASDHLRDIFYRMGFNDREIVALSGAHSLGRCHTDRSGFSGPWTNAPTTVSNEYYRLLLDERWTQKQWNGPKQYEDKSGTLMMLVSDLALLDDPVFRKYVELYSRDEKVWRDDFASAFAKLLDLGVPRDENKSWFSKLF